MINCFFNWTDPTSNITYNSVKLDSCIKVFHKEQLGPLFNIYVNSTQNEIKPPTQLLALLVSLVITAVCR